MPSDKGISRRRIVKGVIASGAAGLAGCLGDDDSGGNGSDGGNGGETEGVEFTAWSFGPNFPVLEEGAEHWNEQNPDTAVPEEISDDAREWTSALQVQEGLPGIGLLHYPIMRSAARNGGLENVNDIVKPNVDQLIDSAISATHVDGNFFAIPHSINPVVIVYNRSMFEDAGLPGNPDDLEGEVETYEDLVGAGEQMQAEIGADLLAHGSQNIRPPNALMTQFGGGFYNPDGEFQFDQPSNVDVFQTLKDLQPYGANLDLFGNVIWDEFKNENVASFLIPGWYLGFITDNLEEMSGEWRIARLPEPNSGGPRGATAGGAPEAIPVAKDDEIKEPAKEFGEFRNMSETSYNQKLRNYIFPANIVEDPEVYDESVEYFGDQQIFEPIGNTLEASPPQDSAPNNEIEQMYQEAYRQIMDEDADIDETLSSTHEDMMEVLPEEDQTRMTVEEVRNSA
jgi:ABC-type glycerol-3-phosphate transport system substrate-binding protein